MNSQKIAFITGASRGFGREIALELARQSYHIIALAKNTENLEKLDDDIQSLGGTATLIPYDLKDAQDFDYLTKALASRFKHLDLLVLNAATSHDLKPLHNLTLQEIDETMNVNFKSQMLILKALDPLLRHAEEPHIVGISDDLAHNPYFGAYALSKRALENALELYKQENTKTRLCVHTFKPKPMRTKLRDQFFPGENPSNVDEPKLQLPEFLTLIK